MALFIGENQRNADAEIAGILFGKIQTKLAFVIKNVMFCYLMWILVNLINASGGNSSNQNNKRKETAWTLYCMKMLSGV